MAFLSPLFLVGALAVAVPIVIHFLRREPEARVQFAAVHMLEHAPVEHADRRRLRQLLLLALRCLALLLLALAFARPFLSGSGAAAASGVTVVALDTSLSMSAPGRFARAQQQARELIRSAPAGHLVGVVTFADAATIAAAPSGDRTAAVRAVDAARAGFGGTRYRAALSAADDALAGRPGQVVVVSDLQASGWDAGDRVGLPSGVAVTVADVGGAVPNLAVTAARRSGDRIVATVRNAGGEPREAQVRLAIDGAPAGEAVGAVGANQSVELTLPVRSGETAEVRVEDPEGIQGDNVRFLLLSEAGQPTVLVITGAGEPGREAFYLQHALSTPGPQGPAFELAGVSGAAVSSWDAARLRRHAAIVLLSTRGLDQRGRELLADYVRDGGGILLAAGPDIDAEVAAGALGGSVEVTPLAPGPSSAAARTLAPDDIRHPVFRAFAADAATLGLVKFRQIAAVRGDTCQAAARYSTGEAAVLDCSIGEGRALVFGSDLDGRWNDFPVHATFLPFLHEATGYLTRLRARAVAFTVGAAPPGAPTTPGFGQVLDGEGPQTRRIAVNVDPRESDPARLTADEFQQGVTPIERAAAGSTMLEARQQEERQNLWRYAILLVMATLVAESVLAARTA